MNMMKQLCASFCVMMTIVTGAKEKDSGGTFRMVVKGKPQVQLARLSYDKTITHAADEFIAYMNAAMKTTGYNGRSGLFTLTFAIAGDGSCELADATMAKYGHSRETLGHDGFLLVNTEPRQYMLCAYSSRGVLNGVYKMFEKAFGMTVTRPIAGLDFPEEFPTAKPIPLPYSEKPAFTIRSLALTG